jgi:hypothetical protein
LMTHLLEYGEQTFTSNLLGQGSAGKHQLTSAKKQNTEVP